MPSEIFEHVKTIVGYLLKKEYVKVCCDREDRVVAACHPCCRLSQANDAYINLAIGNSQWPIGVTSVGIHERASREKIFVDNVQRKLVYCVDHPRPLTIGAHADVMNDEGQRKYITSIKRLMTFVQQKYPTLPSQMVLL